MEELGCNEEVGVWLRRDVHYVLNGVLNNERIMEQAIEKHCNHSEQ